VDGEALSVVRGTVWLVLVFAAGPLVYYLLVLFGCARFRIASRTAHSSSDDAPYMPPVSCLKPIRGLDPDAYENYASFCRQDYPNAYEVLFCIDEDDPAVPVLVQLVRDFPERRIRLLFGSGRHAINDKVARLVRLVDEAAHDLLVVTDSDVRVGPDYLRRVVAPFRDPNAGAGTCLYASTTETNVVQELQSIGMISDFFAGIMVAWLLNGVRFTFGQTIVIRRSSLASFGGYQVIENRPADDLLVGRLVAEQGYEVKLLPYVVQTVPDFASLGDLLHKRMRWMTVMRAMRPWGHFGLLFTWGLPWSLLAVALHPSLAAAGVYLGGYGVLRAAVGGFVGAAVLGQRTVWKKLPLIPVWDAIAFGVWLASFARDTIRWRGVDYRLRQGQLTPVRARTQSKEVV
jgi:ceramide glucosyltransferase